VLTDYETVVNYISTTAPRPGCGSTPTSSGPDYPTSCGDSQNGGRYPGRFDISTSGFRHKSTPTAEVVWLGRDSRRPVPRRMDVVLDNATARANGGYGTRC
jgi:hypothetical protein